MKSYDVALLPEKGGPKKCVLPFYSAEEHTALEKRKGPFTVVEILREVFNEDFEAAAENYIANYPGDIKKALGKEGVEDIRLIRIGEPRFEGSIDDCSYYTSTTVTVIVSNKKLYWCSCGDSRAYLLRNREFVQVTKDQTYKTVLQEQLHAGIISQETYLKQIIDGDALVQ